MRRSLCALLAGLLLTSGGREAPAGAVTLALGGDLSLARGVAQANAADWPATLRAVAPLLRADLVAANLESPLTDAPRVTPGLDLRAPTGAAAALWPLTHLGVVNNHSRDAGPAGEAQSLGTLRRAAPTPVTAVPTVRVVRGQRIALLAWLDDGAAPLPLAAVREAARQADAVIVLAHWGEEYGLTTARQRTQARALAAAGATVIAGSGPHVLQGHEVLTGPRGAALVLYSLGNLLFDQPFPSAQLGAVVRVPLPDVTGACAAPIRTRAGRVTPASGAQRTQALTRLGLPACPEAR
ncbi:CapA family protein [Deinococcus sp. RM]|uniref:CapA family protein n=1 Tax=Deinococcus sp. RM TaxID=2316359 RepID=UPI003AB28E30